jgi:hypothetical protein
MEHTHDTLVFVQRPNKMVIRSFKANEVVGISDWGKFGEIREGGTFVIRGRKWKKLSATELRDLVGKRRIFRLVF